MHSVCPVFLSRFTPGLKDGSNVSFERGECVLYELSDGSLVEITIDSVLMMHPKAPGDRTGYEALFHDTWKRAFAVRCQIIDWDGKGVGEIR